MVQMKQIEICGAYNVFLFAIDWQALMYEKDSKKKCSR